MKNSQICPFWPYLSDSVASGQTRFMGSVDLSCSSVSLSGDTTLRISDLLTPVSIYRVSPGDVNKEFLVTTTGAAPGLSPWVGEVESLDCPDDGFVVLRYASKHCRHQFLFHCFRKSFKSIIVNWSNPPLPCLFLSNIPTYFLSVI